MGHDENPAPPEEGTTGTPPAKKEPTSAGAGSPSVKELLAAARGDVTPADVAIAKAPPAKAPPPVATAQRPHPSSSVPPSPAGDASPTSEIPAATPPAARVAPGAAKSASTPTATVTKGIPKAVAAKASGGGAAVVVQSTVDTPINKMRRRIVWASIVAFVGTSLAMFLRFFLPRAIFEPSSVFRIGFPGDYGVGVDTKWQQQYRIWVNKSSDRLFVIYARCTHLGCTPDWRASENKFKCPCHGSGYDSEGINFEGPAPRPMDRAYVERDAEGQIVVNVGKLYKAPKGERNEFNDDGAFIQI